MIAIVKCCGTNLASINFAFERIGQKTVLTNDANEIASANHVILPGVGTAQYVMSQLKKFQLLPVIRGLTQPVLGICLGMQIMFEFSSEGDLTCLGILPGNVECLPQKKSLPVPHMGWNKLKLNRNDSPLMVGINQDNYVYFVHSYAAAVDSHTIATTDYGKTFASIVNHNNFHGVQFHPERSGHVGEIILRNFLDIS
jgi:glutamine amidotransferase